MNEGLRETAGSERRVYAERRAVRFQEVDAAGVVFHARIFDYFHDAYVALLRERGVPLSAALQDGSWAAPLRSAEAEYRRPLRFGEELTVAIVAVDLSDTEFTITYRIDVAGDVACLGRTRHVSVDPSTFRRAPVPDALRTALRTSAADDRG